MRPKGVLPCVVAAAAAVVVSFAAGLLMLWVAFTIRVPSPSVSLAAAVFQAAALRLVVRLFRARLGDAAKRICGAVGLASVPIVAYGCVLALRAAVVLGKTGDTPIVSDDEVIQLAAVLALAGLCVAMALGGKLAASSASGGTLRAVAYVIVGAGVIAGALGLVRAARFPQPDAYVASFPDLATLPAGKYFGAPEEQTTPAVQAGAARVRRVPPCAIELSVDGTPPSRIDEILLCDTAVHVRHDARHGLWLLVGEPHDDVGHGDPFTPASAFRAGSADSVAVYPRDIGDALAPPRAWLVDALIGVLFAAALGIHARRVARARLRFAAGRQGRHSGGGWLAFDDGAAPIHAPAAASLPVDAPVLCIGAVAVAAGYRGPGGSGSGGEVVRVMAGTREQVERDARESFDADLTFAGGAVVVACTPLAVAACFGLLL
jgi:hypothetical protein